MADAPRFESPIVSPAADGAGALQIADESSLVKVTVRSEGSQFGGHYEQDRI